MKIQIKRPVALHEAGGKSLNEDFIWPTKDKASVEEELFIVCDGEGGPNAGENASKLIGLSFAKFYASTPPVENTQKAYLEAALMKAEAALTAYKEDHEDKKQMKATLSLLHFGKSELCLAWVGDSQAYYYSHGKSELIGSNNSGPGTEDDEFIEGSHKPATINCINIPYEDISEKDYFFLGSKGIAEQVGSTTLSAMFSAKNKPEPEFIAGEINSLSEGFTKDNYSCYLIQVENVVGDMVVTEAGETLNVADAKAEPVKEMAAATAMTASENIYEEKSSGNFWTNVVIGVLAFAFIWVLVALWVGSQENKYDVYMANAEQLISQKNYHNALDQIDSALNHIDREIASNNMTRSDAAPMIAEANKRKVEINNLIARNSGVERKFDLASLESTPEEYLEWAHEAMRLKNYQLALDNYEKAKIKRGEAAEPAIPQDSLALAYLMLGNELYDSEDRDCNKVLAYFNKAMSFTESKILDQGNSIYTQSLRRSGACNLALGRSAGDPNQIAQNSRGLDLNPDANKKKTETKKETQTTPKTQPKSNTKNQGPSRSAEDNSTKRLAPTSGINSTNLSPEDESRMRKALSDGKRFYSQAKSQDSDYLYRQSAIQLEQAATVLDGSGAYLLAYLYHMGMGVDVDNAKALKFAQKSALKNWPAGHYLYAHLLLLRNNPRDTITARQSLNRAAELNYLDAFKRLEELQ
ncbi:MAG: protein phosphatase 2C domain-containing protein [Bacteroidota bacterium]